MTEDVAGCLALITMLLLAAAAFAWFVVLPTIGLLYVAGFLG